MNEDIKVLEAILKEFLKLREKFEKKAKKERDKVNDIYVTVKGEKCYTEEELYGMYEADCINSEQYERYSKKLEDKKKRAGEVDTKTKSEKVIQILNKYINDLKSEISEEKQQIDDEAKRQERLKEAQAKGLSYTEWIESEQKYEEEMLRNVKE
jgi:hypothetical protein